MKTLLSLFLLVVGLSCHAAPGFRGLAGTANAHARATSQPFDWGDCIHYYGLSEAAGQNRADAIGSKPLFETMGGDVATNATGKNGVCADFRSDPLKGFQTAEFTLTEPMSLSFWANVHGAIPLAGIVGKSDLEILAFNDCAPEAFYGLVGGGFGLYSNIGDLDVWHHFTITRDTDHAVVVYVDGVSVQSGNSSDFSSTGVLQVGSIVGLPIPGMNAFDGQIDEIAIFNTVLSPAQVTQLYNGGTGLFYP